MIVVLCSGKVIEPAHLPAAITGRSGVSSGGKPNARSPRDRDEKAGLLAALRQSHGNKSEAARLLGISRVTLWKRLKKYEIEVNAEIRG